MIFKQKFVSAALMGGALTLAVALPINLWAQGTNERAAAVADVQSPAERLAAIAHKLGVEQGEEQQYQAARANFEKAATLVPDNMLYQKDAGYLNYLLSHYDRAIQYNKRALTLALRQAGEGSLAVAHCRNGLALVWKAIGEYEKAAAYFELALETVQLKQGPDSPGAITTRYNLGWNWYSRRDYDQAIRYFESALKSALAVYGENYPKVSKYRDALGLALYWQGHIDQALGYFQWALKGALRQGKPLDIAIIKYHIGGIWYDKGLFHQAEANFKSALETYIHVMGADHPETLLVREDYMAAKSRASASPSP